MLNKSDRRNFLKHTAVLGVSGCALLMAAKFNPLQAFDHKPDGNEVPDPLKMNYCGYSCPADCKFLIATKENNIDKKKEAYEIWRIKERRGVDFDEKKIFCWGCKTPDKPLGVVTSGCTVRKCAIEKGYQACIECNNIASCDKALWKEFPDFHKSVIEMQKSYKASKS
jgi:hypothetical protein